MIAGGTNDPFLGTNNVRGRTFNNSGSLNASSILTWGTGGGINVMTSAVVPNSADGRVDVMPAWVYDNTIGGKGIRGRLPDFGVVSAQVAVGTTYPPGATPEQVVVGHVLLPFTAVPQVG